MKITGIFAVQENSTLFSVAFDNQKDEFHRLFDLWISDIEYLYEFFEENKSDLISGYYGDIKIDEAILKTRKSAIDMQKTFKLILEKRHSKYNQLQAFFRPLDDMKTSLKVYSQEKAKDGWLRIYAIRLNENTYIISGGGIKLTEKMKSSKYLQLEIQKLEITKQFLIEQGATDAIDIGFLEF